jgi:uncharacterized membrane protein
MNASCPHKIAPVTVSIDNRQSTHKFKDGTMTEIRRIPASAGLDWYKQGWELFKAYPAMLVILFLTLFVLYFVVGMIPLLGALIIALASPALTGGYFLALQHAAAGKDPTFEHLFRAFNDPERRNPMLVLGIVALGAQIVMGLISIALIGSSIGTIFALGGMEHGAMIGMGSLALVFLAMLANLIIAVALWLALFFATPLVMLDRVAPIDALKLSLRANLSNFMPWLVFSLILIPLTVVAMIPFGLGLLILFPIVGAAIFRAYEQTFEHGGSGESAGSSGDV